MKVRVIYKGYLTSLATKEEVVEVKEGATVQDLLETLVKRYGPDFEYEVFDEGLIVKDYVWVRLDEKTVGRLDTSETKLSDSATLILFAFGPRC